MNVAVIKAICRRVEERYGSNRAAAMAANVQPSVWSGYCSDDHPTSTIPLHRVLLVANAAERQAFADVLLGGPSQPAPGDLVCEASEVTEAAADMQRVVRVASADGKLTPLERRAVRERAVAVKAEADDVIRLVGDAA